MRIFLTTLAALVASACGDYVRRGSHMMDLDESRRLGKATKAKEEEGRMEKQNKGRSGKTTKATKHSKASAMTAQSGDDKSTDRGTPMETISLGNKRPEGITKGPGDTMFVSEMLYGGIKKVNVLTGEIEQVVPSYGYKERGAYGVIQHGDALFVAGGGVCQCQTRKERRTLKSRST